MTSPTDTSDDSILLHFADLVCESGLVVVSSDPYFRPKTKLKVAKCCVHGDIGGNCPIFEQHRYRFQM